MRKTFLFALLALLALASCGSSSDEPHDRTPEETILFLAPYSGSLSQVVAEDIEDIKSAFIAAGPAARQQLVVFQSIDATRARMYALTWRDGQSVETTINASMAATFTSDDQSANRQLLQDIIAKARTAAPAKCYSMIVGCHGKSCLPAGRYAISSLDGQYPQPKKAFGTATKEGQIDEATLAAAVVNSGIRLNFLLFDACYMANVESAYDLRNATLTFISSPNEILADGMPYLTAARYLFAHDYRSFADAYCDHYAATQTPYATISVIDCRNIEAIANALAAINYTEHSPHPDVSEIQPMDGYMPPLTYDLGDYARHLTSDANLLATFSKALASAVVYERHTGQFVTAIGNGLRHNDIRAFSGLSTMLPTTNATAALHVLDSPFYRHVSGL